MSVEVERKFVCDAGMWKRLEEIGAVCIGQREIHDQYFDTPDFELTLRDTWLRKREDSWELKCPPAVGKTQETSGEGLEEASLCSRYKEITSLPEIQSRVKEVLKQCAGGSLNTDPLPGPLVTVGQEEGVQIDLDQADFGYTVGEIEVLVQEGEEVGSALEKIERAARRLGLTRNLRVEGKMDVYLQRFCPEHYVKLQRAHIL
ncbi:thiamine-triphosphatase isoform X2 [Gadus chalcogrammus]|uniref:thiamine-triphosphatase isoform X2 n=1 Tax=Gadus chalcogrammus TaxID=1042646 RepID=UPI0024C4A0AC|nr:thiamine-triphosphatase isoform X2 [Gadus chalcogrammus]